MRHAPHAFLIALPWLMPVTYGPAPAIAIWVLCAACLGGVGLLSIAWKQERWDDRCGAHAAANGWLFAATVSAVIGLLQYFGAATDASSAFGPMVNTAQMGEAYANLRQRNHFATLTNIGLAALMWRQIPGYSRDAPIGEGRTAKPLMTNAVAASLAALLAAGNAASGSRTGLLQLVFLVALVWIWRNRSVPCARTVQTQVMVAALCAYVLAAILLPIVIGLDPNNTGILARLKDTEASCQSRRVLWANVLHLIVQKPWLGWGWGELDYAHFITLYPGQRFCDILDNAHNLPLHLAVELGVPFAVLVCGLLTWLVVRQSPWRETSPPRQVAWSVLALMALHSMLEYPLWYGPFQAAALLAVLTLWRSHSRPIQDTNPTQGTNSALRRIVGTATVLALAGSAYTGWEYWRITQIYTPVPQRASAYRENTLQKLQTVWMFNDYVRFAELTTTPLTRDNAAQVHALSVEMLHFSPEPQVARLAIESATLLGNDAEAAFYLRRFKAAFPHESLQRSANSLP